MFSLLYKKTAAKQIDDKMATSSFDESKYGPAIEEDNFSEGEDDEVFKGSNVVKVKIDDLESDIKLLRNNYSRRIESLTGSLRQAFDRLVNYISILHGDKSYAIIHDLLKKHFGNLKDIVPGTIGAYFAGCFAKNTYGGSKSCSHICAGSAPLPSDNSSCNYPVVWCNYEVNQYKFVYLSVKPDMTVAVVYVSAKDYKSWIGFSKEEKDELKSKGVERVKLVGYKNGSNEYVSLTEGETDVDDLKDRIQHHHANDSSDAIVYAIIAVIVIGLILWFFFKDGDNNNRY